MSRVIGSFAGGVNGSRCGAVGGRRLEPWGTTALVVGHSNTVPALVRGLTGQALPDDEPVTFDRMWIVTMTRDGAASLLRLRHGAPVAIVR